MPNIYPKKGTRFFWCWGFDSTGKRWDASTKQTDPKAASLAARDIERRFAADPRWKAQSRITLKYGMELVLKYQRDSKAAANTIRATTYHARHLLELLGAATPLAEVTLGDTTKYMTKRIGQGASRHTISKELKTLAHAMRRAEKLGLSRFETSPAHLIPDELGTVYKPRERWLTKEEYAKLLDALTPNQEPVRSQRVPLSSRRRAERQDRRDYVMAYCHLGVRKSELFDIQPGDFNAARGELRVRGTKTESADRLVPVNDDIASVLTRRCALPRPFPRWTDGSCTRDLARACVRAGIATVTPNDLRRTFCSWLCQAGVPERVCAELMGHKSTVMVRAVYGHLDREGMAAAVAKLAKPKKAPTTAAATDIGTPPTHTLN